MTDGVKVACATCRHWDTEPSHEAGWGFCAMTASLNGRARRVKTTAVALDFVGVFGGDALVLGQMAGQAMLQTSAAHYCAMWE